MIDPEKKKPDQSARGWPKGPGNSEWAQRKITENSRVSCTQADAEIVKIQRSGCQLGLMPAATMNIKSWLLIFVNELKEV